jgi:uncharacterized protein YeaC (DUF1315 family)
MAKKESSDEESSDEWFKRLINDPKFWEAVNKKDEENRKNGVYGKHIIKDKKELKKFFEDDEDGK